MNFGEKINHLLNSQGRRKTWLAEQLGVSKVVLHNKIKDNRFSYEEMAQIKRLFGVKSVSDYRDVMEP